MKGLQRRNRKINEQEDGWLIPSHTKCYDLQIVPLNSYVLGKRKIGA